MNHSVRISINSLKYNLAIDNVVKRILLIDHYVLAIFSACLSLCHPT